MISSPLMAKYALVNSKGFTKFSTLVLYFDKKESCLKAIKGLGGNNKMVSMSDNMHCVDLNTGNVYK